MSPQGRERVRRFRHALLAASRLTNSADLKRDILELRERLHLRSTAEYQAAVIDLAALEGRALRKEGEGR